ncbi:MAG TPA: DNA polymerase III subunit delta' C-terminal domain-containing protein [Syntrophorhabdaceae bacterium]|jgi:DNA polymerase-3 subunit delta'
MGFSSIIGHDRQKEFLLSLHKRERLPHAFLFSGQEGVGKRKLALEFIKHILCDEGTGCDRCRPCLKLAHGTHPDLLIVEGTESIGIAQARMISREVCEHPYEGRKRAVIIDRAETMTREAANALLKTLEEPPPFNIFFLITSSEREIPFTVRSRAARVTFGPLTHKDVEDYLVKILKMEQGKAQLLSSQSYGSIGCALFWAEKENLLLRRTLGELVMGKTKGYVTSTILSERISKTERSLGLYLSFLLSFFCDLYKVRYGKVFSPLVNKDLKDLIEWGPADLRWIEGSLQKIQETILNMRYNINKWLLFENMLLHIMR